MDSPHITVDSSKSPMDNLLHILTGLSAGHEKALKQGIYNAVALFLLCLVCAAGYGLYIVLGPFIKPLVWALLCGAALFPFKTSLSMTFESWFELTQTSSKPFLICLSMVPISIFDKFSNFIGSFLHNNIRYISSIVLSFIGITLLYNYTPQFIVYIFLKLFSINTSILDFCLSLCNKYVISLIIVGYFSLLFIYWKTENSNTFRYYSFGIWFMISLFISNIFDSYSIVIFITLQILFMVGLIYEVILSHDKYQLENHHPSLFEIFKSVLFNIPVVKSNEVCTQDSDIVHKITSDQDQVKDLNEIDGEKKANLSKPKPFLKTTGKSYSMNLDMHKSPSAEVTRRVRSASNVTANKLTISDHFLITKLRSELRMSLDLEDDKVDSAKYMYGAMYACIGMIFWKNLWILNFLIIPVIYFYLKKLNSYCGFSKLLKENASSGIANIKKWCYEREDAIIPVYIKGLIKIIIIVDNKLTQFLKASIDTVTTTVVILTLVIFVICGSIFITIQIYAEGMHLIQVGGEILNSTLISNPDIDWVPQQWEESVNSVLDNAYIYGRTAISDNIRKLLKDFDPSKASQLEKKVLELWDRMYQAWMMSNSDPNMIGPSVDTSAAYSVLESIQESFGKSFYQLFNMASLQNFVQDNIVILMSVLDSIWSILKGNMTLFLSLVTDSLYIIIMGGSVVLNFSLSVVVFFTALFYLLSTSGKMYKPIDLITNFSPIGCHRFATALQESIIGVFTATFKLASFFGMWTWFTHNLFQLKIVYLPSVIATVLGAVPFLDAYFACIPATIELWFTQGSLIAIIFFLFHFIPCNIVVTEFYAEIKGGGHPYLTGLSIAGGVFCLGIEGAIFGPLLLCCIMVAINLSKRYLQNPSEETIKTIKSHIGNLE